MRYVTFRLSADNMDKSRKLGWHGHVDTRDAIFDSITELAELKWSLPFTN